MESSLTASYNLAFIQVLYEAISTNRSRIFSVLIRAEIASVSRRLRFASAAPVDSRRLRVLRNGLTEADPRWRARCPDVQRRLEVRLIVQRGETNGHECWNG